MAKEAKIRCFRDLYDYFRKHKELFSFLERPHHSIPSIEVNRIDEKGKTIIIMEEEPEPHEQLARYIFSGIEVSQPEISLSDENTIKAIIKNLLSPDIFEYPPSK